MSFKRILLTSCFFSAGLLGLGAVSYAQSYEHEGGFVIERLQADYEDNGIFQALKSSKVERRKIEHIDALRTFYEARGFEPYWTNKASMNSNGREMLEFLEDAWSHGLNPHRYHLDTIRGLSQAKRDIYAMHALEVLLSDAYVAYGQDLTGIRVNPKEMKSHKRFWQTPYTPDALLELVQNDDDIDDVIKSFTPRGNTYNRLRKELVRLVQEPPEDFETVLPIKMRGLLRPYEEHQVVHDLRVRFDLEPNESSLVYDDELAAAIMNFQRDNGLEADGVIGPATMRAINKSRRHRIHQLIANLERLRWVAEEKPDKFVIVNVPSAMLWAVEGGRVDFQMPVVVGRKKRPTNIFITDITGVRLNPTWTVPPTIKKEDILPKLRHNSSYLDNKGMTLIHGSGADALTLDARAIDWNTVSEGDLKRLRMVQKPGSHNPLGDVRVLMPNGYNIYLHDTNEKHYFKRQARAVSSGCIRMKYPMKMVDFIMREKPGWSDEDTQAVLDRGKIRDIYLPKDNTIPVYLVYYTAWIGDDNDIIFGNDLYDYDDKLIKMLINLDEIFIPVNNTGVYRENISQSGY